MGAKLPVGFEEKVKQPASPNGKGYPYQLSAKDLDANFKYLLGRLMEGVSVNDTLYWDGNTWNILPSPSSTGTHVLGCVDGSMQWLSTEECA